MNWFLANILPYEPNLGQIWAYRTKNPKIFTHFMIFGRIRGLKKLSARKRGLKELPVDEKGDLGSGWAALKRHP